MIPFVASLFDINGNSGVAVDSKCQNITINDYSNYLTNTQPGCAISDFNQYFAVVVTHQSGATYVISSLPSLSPNLLVPPPSLGATSYTVPVFAGDGVYTVQLFTVPTYNNSAAYIANAANVYFSGNLYQSILNTTGNTPSSTSTFWSTVQQNQLLISFQDDAPTAIMCNLTSCMNNAVYASVCEMKGCNNFDFCTNPKFLLASKLTLLFYNIQAAMMSGNLQSASDSFDLANTLCKPCPGC